MPKKESKSAAELVIMREFNAPRELVWKAWTDPGRLALWWGPKDVPIKVHRFEFHPGGTFLYSMHWPDGQEWWGKFIYHEIVAAEKIIFVISFSDAQGGITRHPTWPEWPLEVHQTLLLTGDENKTTLTLRGKPIHATEAEIKFFAANVKNVQQGFKGTFDQLEEYLLRA